MSEQQTNQQTKRQIFALAAALTAINLVNNLATKGTKNDNTANVLLKSLWVFEPTTTFEVYDNNFQALQSGYRTLRDFMEEFNFENNTSFYVTELIKRTDTLMDDIKSQNTITQALQNIDYQGELSVEILQDIANIQVQFAKNYAKPLKINGDRKYLTDEYNINLIRTLLLCAMRAFLLWRQLGGSRSHFFFKRAEINDVITSRVQ
jgi:high frequency lysogenization protein